MCIINHPDQNPNENLFSHHSFHDSISMTEREREREKLERESQGAKQYISRCRGGQACGEQEREGKRKGMNPCNLEASPN
jgi:hypothetical protein